MTRSRYAMLLFAAALIAVIAIGQFDQRPTEQEQPSMYTPPEGGSELLQFMTEHFFDASGGVYTNLRDDLPAPANTAVNHMMLSESSGLLMQYAVNNGDRRLFDHAFRFVTEHLYVPESGIRWVIDPGAKPKQQPTTNAAVDDLRIIRALLIADRLWGGNYLRWADKLAGPLLASSKDGLLVDYYDWATDSKADTVTASYLDLIAMRDSFKLDDGWYAVYERSRQLLRQAQLPSGLFRQTFNLSTQEWAPVRQINMIDTLYCALHMAEDGQSPESTIHFISTELDRTGKLYGRYTPTGQPASDIESPAVYALAIRLFAYAGQDRYMTLLSERLEALSVTDSASDYRGGFVQLPSKEAYSFDHLEALLAETERKNHS